MGRCKYITLAGISLFRDELFVEIGSNQEQILGRFDCVRGKSLRLIEEMIRLPFEVSK